MREGPRKIRYEETVRMAPEVLERTVKKLGHHPRLHYHVGHILQTAEYTVGKPRKTDEDQKPHQDLHCRGVSGARRKHVEQLLEIERRYEARRLNGHAGEEYQSEIALILFCVPVIDPEDRAGACQFFGLAFH